MAGAKLEKTRHSGIYQRPGKRGATYVVLYRDQDAASAPRPPGPSTTPVSSSGARRPATRARRARLAFAEYALDWVERHDCRDTTRDDYRAHLNRWIVPFVGEKRKLADITPLLLNQLVAHLRAAEGRSSARPLADSTVQTILKPLRACFAQARAEGLIRHNPSTGLRVPKRETTEDEDEEQVRALTGEQLATVLSLVSTRHRLAFRFLAATGLRVSEWFAVQWRHLELDGAQPHVRVRRAWVRGA